MDLMCPTHTIFVDDSKGLVEDAAATFLKLGLTLQHLKIPSANDLFVELRRVEDNIL